MPVRESGSSVGSRVGCMFLMALILCQPLLAIAKDRTKSAKKAADDKPVLIINVASFERLLNHAVFAFDQGGRPELAETLGTGLAKVNDLKGLNRQQSMGVLLYVNNVLAEKLAGSGKPMVSAVGYVPVKNIDDLLKAVQIGKVTTNKVGDNLYEIDGGRQKMHVLVRGDYAFVADRRDSFDHDLGDPAAFSKPLSSAYDVGVSVMLSSLSQSTRDLVAGTLRAQAENDLQRRDNEPVAAHRLRRAAGMQRLELLESILSQGDQLTAGWTLSETEKTSAVEIVVAAKPGSDFAGTLNELRGTRTHFANLLTGRPPAGAALSLKLNKGNRKLLQEMLAAIELGLVPEKPKEPAATTPATEAPAKPPVEAVAAPSDDTVTAARQLIKTFTATIEQGQLDGFVQFLGHPPGPFVLVGGIKLADADQASGPLQDLLDSLRKSPQSNFSEVPAKGFSHQGIEMHRINFKDSRWMEKRVYGESSSLYMGAGKSVLWFAVGGEEAVVELKRAIDQVAEPVRNPTQALPFQFVVNVSEWLEIVDPLKRATLSRQALTDGKDSVRFDIQGIQDGMRLRLRFDEGFTKLIGLGMIRGAEADERRRAAAEAAKQKAAEPKTETDTVPEKK